MRKGVEEEIDSVDGEIIHSQNEKLEAEKVHESEIELEGQKVWDSARSKAEEIRDLIRRMTNDGDVFNVINKERKGVLNNGRRG